MFGIATAARADDRAGHMRVAGWPGRQWTGVQTLAAPAPWRYGAFCWQPGGAPRLWVAVGADSAPGSQLGAGRSVLDLPPREATRAFDPLPGQALAPVAPVGAPAGTAWIGCAPGGFACAVLWSAGAATDAAPETVLTTFDQDSELAAAASGSVCWVARSQQLRAGSAGFRVRIATSVGGGPWGEAPPLGVDEFSCALAPAGETTAVLVTAGASGLRWALLAADGAVLGEGALDPVAGNALHARLVAGRAGAPTLAWTTRGGVHAASLADGLWAGVDSVRCAHADSPDYWSSWLGAATAPDGQLAVAWGDRGFGTNGRDVACFARRDPRGGFTQAGEIPGSDGAFAPAVFCDSLGEAWVAWSAPGGGSIRWCHTWSAATVASMTVDAAAEGTVLRARLDAAAPGTAWSIVVQADGDARERVVARVVAGEGPELRAVLPAAAMAGRTRAQVRIRRDAIDPECRWTSPAVEWTPAR